MDRKKEIAELLTRYLSAFPTSKIDGKGIAIYATVLQSHTVAEVNAAMLKLLNTCKFFPSCAEIVEQIGKLKAHATESRLPSADEAWEEAMRLAHDKFVYGKWEYSSQEVEQAVKTFGKMALCELEPDGMNTARAQFMRIYSAICERKREAAQNEAVLKSLPQKQIKMLVGGMAEKMALGVGK